MTNIANPFARSPIFGARSLADDVHAGLKVARLEPEFLMIRPPSRPPPFVGPRQSS